MLNLGKLNAPNQAVLVGRITSPYGIKGWVKLCSHTKPIQSIFSYKNWWLKTPSTWKNLELSQGCLRGHSLIASIKDHSSDRSQAEEICGSNIYVDIGDLPKLETGDFYWEQLKKLRVKTKEGILLGKVFDLMETGANDVLIVCACKGSFDFKERLIPYVPDVYVLNIDLEQQQMVVDWDPDF